MERHTIAEWRGLKGLSKKEVYTALNVHNETYDKYEETPSKMPVDKADGFCRLLGIKMEDVNFFP